ncbi:hypothetical protein Bbelb_107270 [Branchiostoma belcheri]|nr:hypothetical protein Bbelb_107270 [Branchiostoma belcheri]
MAGVQPFRFEPQTDSSGDSEPDPGDDNVWDGGDVETERWRLGNRDWCRCGQDEDNRNCLEMPSVRESVCCHDLPELTDTEKNVGPYQQPQLAQRGILAASYVLADRLKWRALQICSNETFYVTDSVAAPPSGQSGASRETSIGSDTTANMCGVGRNQ